MRGRCEEGCARACGIDIFLTLVHSFAPLTAHLACLSGSGTYEARYGLWFSIRISPSRGWLPVCVGGR